MEAVGVDLTTYKAEQLGYYPQVVLAGRRINDGMGRWLVEQLILEMARRGQVISGAQVLVLGLSFKENCPICGSKSCRRDFLSASLWYRASHC